MLQSVMDRISADPPAQALAIPGNLNFPGQTHHAALAAGGTFIDVAQADGYAAHQQAGQALLDAQAEAAAIALEAQALLNAQAEAAALHRDAHVTALAVQAAAAASPAAAGQRSAATTSRSKSRAKKTSPSPSPQKASGGKNDNGQRHQKSRGQSMASPLARPLNIPVDLVPVGSGIGFNHQLASTGLSSTSFTMPPPTGRSLCTTPRCSYPRCC